MGKWNLLSGYWIGQSESTPITTKIGFFAPTLWGNYEVTEDSKACHTVEASSTRTEKFMSKAESKVTFDHDEIKRWAEERGAKPACVRGTGNSGDVGMIRLDFPGYTGEESLEHISWDDWFGKFDERNLSLLYQEQTAGGERSNFNKIVSRETAESAEETGRTERVGAAAEKKTAESQPRHSERTVRKRAAGHK